MNPAISSTELMFAAIQMEQAGHGFYRALAATTDNPEVRQFCEELAQEEARHLGTFRKLRDGLNDGSIRINSSVKLTKQLMKAIAPPAASVQKTAESGDLKSAVDLAMEMEASAIRFYSELRTLVPEQRAVLDAIIEEENRHLTRLQAFAHQGEQAAR